MPAATFVTTSQSSLIMQKSQSIGSVAGSSTDEVDEMLTLIDTTLIKAYFITNDALIGPLLRVTNRCNVEETETLLVKHKVRLWWKSGNADDRNGANWWIYITAKDYIVRHCCCSSSKRKLYQVL
jgi:hypothetical protein